MKAIICGERLRFNKGKAVMCKKPATTRLRNRLGAHRHYCDRCFADYKQAFVPTSGGDEEFDKLFEVTRLTRVPA